MSQSAEVSHVVKQSHACTVSGDQMFALYCDSKTCRISTLPLVPNMEPDFCWTAYDVCSRISSSFLASLSYQLKRSHIFGVLACFQFQFSVFSPVISAVPLKSCEVNITRTMFLHKNVHFKVFAFVFTCLCSMYCIELAAPVAHTTFQLGAVLLYKYCINLQTLYTA